MVWIAVLVSVLTLLLAAGAFFLLEKGRPARADVRKRLSLLELRNLGTADLPEVLKSELLSDVPPLNRLLSRLDIAVRIDRRLRQADLEIRVGTFVLLSLFLFAAGFAAGNYLRWPAVLGLAAGLALFAVPNLYVGIKRRLRIKRFMNHFPDALEMFARSLRAGHSFTGAIQLVAQEMPDPVGPEFRKVFEEQNLGMPLRQALIGMTERVDALDVRFFATAVLIQRETGGNLAEIIDKISYVIRERFRIQGQLRIFTTQARMTGFILMFLPIGVALLIGIFNAEYLKPLWYHRTGKIMVATAVVMQVLGMLAIRRIIRIKI